MHRHLGVAEPIAALNKIKIIENNEPLVDLRVVCSRLDIRPTSVPFVRKTVADMINKAIDDLPEGYTLHLRSALRSMREQKAQWNGYYEKLQQKHPHWPKSCLCRSVNRYYAPYNQIAPPGHSTGAAVDVFLLNPDGKMIDHMPPFEHDWSVGHTFATNITPEVKAHRTILYNVMMGAGFSNCRDEYWHYSYGDSAWAVRMGKTTCMYHTAKDYPKNT